MGAVSGGFDLGKFNNTGDSHIGDPKEDNPLEKRLKKAIYFQPVAAFGAASGAFVFVGGLAFKAFTEIDLSTRVIVAGGVVGLVSYDVYQVLGNAKAIVARPILYKTGMKDGWNADKIKTQLGKKTLFSGWVVDALVPAVLNLK